MIRRPPRSTLFPYTTLFRSLLGTLPSLIPSDVKARYPNDKTGQINTVLGKNPLLFDRYLSDAIEVDVDALCDGRDVFVAGIMEHIRSEEYTSELQSRQHLVCRLLLEKKDVRLPDH